MIDPADVKILASHCAYDVLQSEEAVFVVEEFYARRLDPIAVLRLSMCDRNVGSLRSAGNFPVGLLDRPGPPQTWPKRGYGINYREILGACRDRAVARSSTSPNDRFRAWA